MTVAASKPVQMSQSGLNLIRFVLASYFIALSLGMIKGVDITAIAKLHLTTNTAEFVSNTLVFLCAYLVLMGMWLRPAALILAGFVLVNSGYTSFLAQPAQYMGDFWRDVAMVAGLMMTYLQSNGREATRQPALIRKIPTLRKIRPTEKVKPRRVLSRPIKQFTSTRTERGENTGRTERPEFREPAELVNMFAA